MPINREKIKLLAQAWDKMLLGEKEALSSDLSCLDISALSSWVRDCSQIFEDIYAVNLEKIKNASPDDFGVMHDCVVDIFWQLDHIKNHIGDAEEGFPVLMSLLAKKAKLRGP